MKILLDTNVLMMPGQFKVDIYSQLSSFSAQLYTTDLSVKELDKIASGRGRDAANARLALLLVKKEGVKIIPSGKPKTSRIRGQSAADEAIRRIAKREGMVVCTADQKLKIELRKRKIRIMSLRQKKFLEFV